MALAVATSPAHVDGASVSSTVSTASFNAAAKTLLVACIGINTSSGGTSTFTVSDNKGLTWNTQAAAGRPAQAQNGLAVIATAWVSSAQTGVVVTVTTAGSTSTTRRPSIDVFVVTGAHDTTPIAAAVIGTNNNNAPSLSVSSTVANSLMFVSATDWQKWGAGTATGFDTARNWDQAGSDGVSGMSGYAARTTVGTWNYGLDAPGTTASNWNLARIEVAPALAPTASAGADVASHAVSTLFSRTATDSPNGDPISARSWKIQAGPTGVGTTIGTAAALSWTPTTVGTYTLRYSATNAIGTTTDDMDITVAALAPTVSAGADVTGHNNGTLFSRTATDSANGATITARSWKIQAGPTGVGSTLATAAGLSWTPSTPGNYTLRYSATNSVGTSTDDMTIQVVAFPPTVDAGLDVADWPRDALFTRTATEDDGHATITARAWTIVSGPAGVGSTIGTAAALSWTPTVSGLYVLQYEATNSQGSDTDTVTIVVTSPGEPFIPELGDDSKVRVEIAWGADLTDITGSTWSWIDVTTHVRTEQGITVSLGRNDEASNSNPAKLGLVLDNSGAHYSLGGHSPNWPNVRRNVPVRVSINPGDGLGHRLVFQGYAVGFTPGWDSDAGRVPIAELEAAGVLRRLIQGQDPLGSALYRYLTLVVAPAEYWPLEETGTAVRATSAAGGSVATFEPILDSSLLYGKVKWGGDTDNPATSRAVQVSAGGSIYCPVRSSLFPGYWAVSFSMRFTSASGGFFRFRTTTGVTIAATFFTDGNVEVYDGITTAMSWSMGNPIDWDDVWHHYLLVFNGTSWAAYVDGSVVDTYTTATERTPTRLEFTSSPDPGGTEDPIGLAHVAMFSAAPTIGDLADAAAAHVGETADDRLVRLCAEQNVALTVVGTSPDLMGPQLPVSFVDLLRECEAVDQGVLFDGVGPGLRYVCRDERENAPTDLTLDATDLVQPFGPVDDDQRTQNRVTANGSSGAKVTVEDTTGPLGTAVVGVYDSSVDVNVADDDDVADYAGWAVHLGTVEGYRYPQVGLNMRSTPILAPSVMALEPSKRVTIESIGDVVAAMPAGDVGLLVEGLAMKLGPRLWTVTLKCSPAAGWSVDVLAEDTGDTDEHLARLRTDGSTVPYVHSAGDLGLYVATTSGPLWTTDADDYPLTLDVGGVPVRATACSGASSPQVFTTDPLPQHVAVGTPVDVWNPPALGL